MGPCIGGTRTRAMLGIEDVGLGHCCFRTAVFFGMPFENRCFYFGRSVVCSVMRFTFSAYGRLPQVCCKHTGLCGPETCVGSEGSCANGFM